MGNRGGKEKTSKIEKSRKGDSKDKNQSKTKKKKGHFKVLTLGISGSGKSTFAKQMKILYCGGFSQEEALGYKEILLKNTMIGMQELVRQAEKLDLQILEENKKRARFFQTLNPYEQEWTDAIPAKLKELWADPAIRQAWSTAPEFQLQMSMMEYHINNLDRYASDGFIPTNDDMLRARQRTTGMIETTFDIERYSWTLIDVGGQKPERSKWESVIDETINAVIYFAALDEYNMASTEEPGKTKMQIAIEIFQEVSKSELRKGITLLLFLNKSDLFQKKIVESTKDYEAFQKIFPTYTGGRDLTAATKHFTEQFTSCVANTDELHTHVTCALDTEAMDNVFKAVKDTLFMNKLATRGLL